MLQPKKVRAARVIAPSGRVPLQSAGGICTGDHSSLTLVIACNQAQNRGFLHGCVTLTSR